MMPPRKASSEAREVGGGVRGERGAGLLAHAAGRLPHHRDRPGATSSVGQHVQHVAVERGALGEGAAEQGVHLVGGNGRRSSAISLASRHR